MYYILRSAVTFRISAEYEMYEYTYSVNKSTRYVQYFYR